MQDEFRVTLQAVHLNHGLRADAADADTAYVKQFCAQLGVPLTTEKIYVKEYQAAHRLTLEEAAREVRYQFLARVAARIGAPQVAVAHTADDNLETVLMHLLRGSGLNGLEGLKLNSVWHSAVNDTGVTVIRPLLDFTRAETLAYAALHRLKPREDKSNYDPAYFRNRVRREFLPWLEEFSPAVRRTLHRLARLSGEDLALLDAETDRHWQAAATVTDGAVELRREAVAGLPRAYQRRLLRRAVMALHGNLKDIEWRHVEQMLTLCGKGAGKRINLPHGLIFSAGYEVLRLSRELPPSPYPPLAGEIPLLVPGTTAVGGWTVRASLSGDKRVHGPGDEFSACLDRDRCGEALRVRTRRRGDRFQPLGMDQLKKLSDHFIDARVPSGWRDSVPLLTDGERLLWVVGSRLDDRVKVTTRTRRVLRLEFRLTADGGA